MIAFNTIPSDIRVPLFYAEVDNSQAGATSQSQRALLIGQMTGDGNAEPGDALSVPTTDAAKNYFGQGSMLARMHELFRKQNPLGEVWCIGLDDADGATAAERDITITGPATASGTLYLYIGGQLVKVGVTSGDTATAIAAAVVAAVTAKADLPVDAANAAGVVTLTCKWAGSTGMDIPVSVNYRGLSSGEKLPAGVTVTIDNWANGATDPDLADVVTAMGQEEFEFVISGYSDATSLTTLEDAMNDSSGRWAYNRQLYGHVYAARRGTFNALQTFGDSRNNQHITVGGFETGIQAPAWEVAGAFGGRTAAFIGNDPARPTQTGELLGILLPKPQAQFQVEEQETLLRYGIATFNYSGGVMRIQRAITTYQKNAFDQPDASYLDSETMHTSSYVLRALRSAVLQKYARHKLRNDGTQFGANDAIVTPNIIRGEMIGVYATLERRGIVENAELFAKYLVVERNADDPNRIDVLFPADYVNQLRVLAVSLQFRLQFPEGA